MHDPIANVASTAWHRSFIRMHWLTVLLLIAVYALIELRGIYPKGSDARELMKTWHEMLGLTVFGLTFVRLALRFAWPAPAVRAVPAYWQRLLAQAVHVALYAFLFIMPVLGWLILSAKGKPVPFFGLTLPPLMSADQGAAASIEEIHEFIGTLAYGLIGLHAAAALWHHYVRRDDTLRRMLPLAASQLRDSRPSGDFLNDNASHLH